MPDGEDQRLDRWLFFARLLKSRTLAAAFVRAGHVRINSLRAEAPDRRVKPGDVLTLAFERQVLVLRVLAAGTRRGPAVEARTLYERLEPVRG